ncbi:MAG: SUMF1/EgtB/PvdO family nonheme iron enzyme [Chthoniobacter sp.]|uniref:protein kinase domain-containing protein n=1 Tax=Chthoniobacter sp. TaxID=2510640 RepID=UPI0032A4783C
MPAPQTEVLVFADGYEAIRRVLGAGTYVFGRLSSCDFPIKADLVSRQHARLTIGEDRSLLLEDLNSANGTLLDGQPITAPTPVTPNQTIQIGTAHVLIQYRVVPDSEDPTSAALHEPKLQELTHSTHYEMGVQIAKGGMGAVLAARQPAIRRDVAMKIMLREQGPHDRLRFIEEAQLTGQLEHPNIVPVHDLALDHEGRPYYTMKLVKGATLKRILRQIAGGDAETIAHYPLAALLTIFQKVCDAVGFAHAKGVIHRDLKPENIMVGEYGEVLVMDWGLAKAVGVRSAAGSTVPDPVELDVPSVQSARLDQRDIFSTLDGSVMGTPAYMSPEQARGEVTSLDRRSDIFSLGAILFELVTLLQPFTGKTPEEIVENIKQGRFEYPTARLRSQGKARPPHLPRGLVSESLEAIIVKALSLKRSQRYPSVKKLQGDLTAYQSGFATSAEQAGPWKQFRLLVLRHQGLSLTVGIGLLALLGVSAAFVRASLLAKNETRATHSEHERANTLSTALDQTKRELLQARQTSRDMEAKQRSSKNEMLVSLAQTKQALQVSEANYRSAEFERSVLQRTLAQKFQAEFARTTPAPPSPTDQKTKPPKATEPFVNSLGMVFVPVPITGGATSEKPVLFSVWDTRVQDFSEYERANKLLAKTAPFAQGPTHPVVEVNWDEAKAFCTWLTAAERKAGKIKTRDEYRLPTDHEWSSAVGIAWKEEAAASPDSKSAAIGEVYPWGTQWPPPKGAGNYASSLHVDEFEHTSPVGSFTANRYGIFDLGGNVWQWCEDKYNAQSESRVMRGGCWGSDDNTSCSSSYRHVVHPSNRYVSNGFRCVLVLSEN